MMTNPALRFRNFDQDFTEYKIKDIAPLQRGFDLPVSQIVAGDYPVVFSNGPLKKHCAYKAKAPGVVTGRSGTIGKLSYIDEDYWPHNTALWVTDFKGNHPKFIYYMYEKVDLSRFATGSGVPTLNRNDVHDYKTSIPCNLEQQKIADFLSSVDKKVSLLKEKHTLLTQYKKGVMQKLFKQEIRFKDENGSDFPSWRNRKLNELLFEHKKRNIKLEFGKENVLSVSGELGIVNQIEHLGRSYAGESVANYHIVHEGDVVYTKSPLKANPFGIIKSNQGKAGIVSTLYAVYSCKETAYHKYLDYYFSIDDNVNKYLRPLVHKGAKNDMKINNQRVLIDPISIPSVDEQRKIVSFLESFDKKLEAVNQQIELTQTFKKGLLQQMFV